MTVTEGVPVSNPDFPSVVLTPRAFHAAENDGIIGVEPNLDVMREIGELAGATEVYVPDLTVIRWYHRTHWDTCFSTAPPSYMYHVAHPSDSAEKMSAAALRRGIEQQNSTASIELTVNDWNSLGETYAQQVLNTVVASKGFGAEQAVHYISGVGGILARAFGIGGLYESPEQRLSRQVQGLQPYHQHRRGDILPVGPTVTPR